MLIKGLQETGSAREPAHKPKHIDMSKLELNLVEDRFSESTHPPHFMAGARASSGKRPTWRFRSQLPHVVSR